MHTATRLYISGDELVSASAMPEKGAKGICAAFGHSIMIWIWYNRQAYGRNSH